MSYHIGPYDLIGYHNRLSEFFDPYAAEIDNNNSLLLQIEKAGEVINRFFREDVIDYTYPVRNTVIIGRAIQSINDIQVVKPDGEPWENSSEEIYAKKLLTEENPWKTVYELEVAQSCIDAGLDTNLIHEGEHAGPDILVNCNNERVDIECKRRDTYNSKRDYDYKEIREKILDRLDIGEDSFFIELTADGPLEEQAIDSVIDLAVQVVENRESEATCEINSVEYRVILKDYYQGEKKLDISKKDVERWMNNDIISPHTIHSLLSSFDENEISKGSFVKSMFKFTESGETITKSGVVFDFTFPTIDDQYYERIVNTTLKSGREDLKNRSPAVLFLHLPAYETEDLSRYWVQEGQYDPTPQIQRLEQRIEGELNDSTSVNAVVLNTTHFGTKGNNCHVIRGYKVFENTSPKNPIPREFRKYLSDELSNDNSSS